MASDERNLTGGLLSARTLLGYRVENPRGESLGRIEDFVIGSGGRVAYAVVSFGGVLGLWNKLFAFPWSALEVDRPREKAILDLDRKALATARGFAKDHWPDLNDWPAEPAPAPASRPRIEVERQEAPAAAGLPPAETAAPSRNQMDYWGKTWQSHGLDRP